MTSRARASARRRRRRRAPSAGAPSSVTRRQAARRVEAVDGLDRHAARAVMSTTASRSWPVGTTSRSAPAASGTASSVAGQRAVVGVGALESGGGRQLGDRPAPLALREPGQPARALLRRRRPPRRRARPEPSTEAASARARSRAAPAAPRARRRRALARRRPRRPRAPGQPSSAISPPLVVGEPRSSSSASRADLLGGIAAGEELARRPLDRLLVVGELEVSSASSAVRAPARRRCS